MEPMLPPRIPTVGKSPHPPGYSYPVGASAISEVLLGVPQFERFTVRYSNRSPLLSWGHARSGFPVLRLTFTNYPVYKPRAETISKTPQGGEHWALEVLPAPHEQRLEIQKALLEVALVDLREWLLGPEAPNNSLRRLVRECWHMVGTGEMKWLTPDET